MNKLYAVWLGALLCAGATGALADGPACAGPGSAGEHARGVDGERLEFDVLRNGKTVGRHVTRFTREQGYLVVESEMTLRIRLLFIDAYRYRYSATERWCDGRLVDLDAEVDANGESSAVAARTAGQALEIVGPHGRTSAPLGLFSTNHWHPGVLRTDHVLNTLTGRINRVRIEHCASPRPDGEGPDGARCYEYRGDLDARVWYDAAQRWVGLAFDGEDGSRFEYRCRHCGPAHAARSAL